MAFTGYFLTRQSDKGFSVTAQRFQIEFLDVELHVCIGLHQTISSSQALWTKKCAVHHSPSKVAPILSLSQRNDFILRTHHRQMLGPMSAVCVCITLVSFCLSLKLVKSALTSSTGCRSSVCSPRASSATATEANGRLAICCRSRISCCKQTKTMNEFGLKT